MAAIFRFQNAAPFFGAGTTIVGNVTDRSPCLSEKVVLEIVETVPPNSTREGIAEANVLGDEGSFSLPIPPWAPATFSAELLPGVRPSVTYCIALVRDRVVRGETVVVVSGRALDPAGAPEAAAGPLTARMPVNEAPARHVGPLLVSVALENATLDVAHLSVTMVKRIRYTHVAGMAREDEVWRSPEPLVVPPYTFLSANVGFPAPSTHSLRSRHIECTFAVRVSSGAHTVELPLSVVSSASSLAPGSLDLWDPVRTKTLLAVPPVTRALAVPVGTAAALTAVWQGARLILNDSRLFHLDLSARASAPRIEVSFSTGAVAVRLARDRVPGLLDSRDQCEWGEDDGPGRITVVPRGAGEHGLAGRWWLAVIGFSVATAEFQVRMVANAPMFSILDEDDI